MNPRTKSQDIRDLSQNDIRELVAELGQPAFRAKQLIEWVFEKNVCSFDDMTNLPKAFREQLKEAFAFDTPTELTKQVSKDGSRKYLLEYHDGISVETVGMPRRNKLSVCVSTQAGCGMGCAFCATGLNGLKRSLTAQEIVDQVLALPERTKIQVLAPVVRGRKGEHQKEFEAARKGGFVRVRADGLIYDLSETIKLEKNKKHNIEIVVDRLVIKPDIRSRLADSLETAAGLSGGIVIVNVIDGEDILFSQNYACPEHGVSIEELSPRMFSFNNPYGACEKCTG